MFGASKGVNTKSKGMAVENVLNTIAAGTVLEGKITTKGDIRIEGTVVGTVTCDAKLVIGELGSVEGLIDARNAYIAGKVKGLVIVRDLLQLQEKGHILGDIYTQKLSVQIGASFTGNCKMGADAKTMLTEAQARLENTEVNGQQRPALNGQAAKQQETPTNVSLVND
jgi:cytoskeletal protein CcmA (bactofilin family)